MDVQHRMQLKKIVVLTGTIVPILYRYNRYFSYKASSKSQTPFCFKDSITLGVQSGSERVRSEIYKRYTSDKMIIECAKIFKKHVMV